MSTTSITATTVAEGVSHSVTNSEKRNGEFSIEIPIPKLGKMFGYTQGWKTEATETNQKISYQSVEETVQKTTTYTEELSQFPKGMYYAFAAYADLNIFLDVSINLSTNTFIDASICHGASNVRVRFVSTSDQQFSIPQTDDYLVKVPQEMLFQDIYPVGEGTAESPYEVSQPIQFVAMKGWPDKQYKLANDISLEGFDSSAVGYAYRFDGVFDGNGKTIRGFKIKKPLSDVFAVTKANDQYFGLFARLKGTVKNLTLDSAAIQLTNGTVERGYPNANNHFNEGSGRVFAGLVCGAGEDAGSRIENVTLNNCEVVAHTTHSAVGGIAGAMKGEISESKVKGLVMVCYGNGGGIAGDLRSGAKVDNCVVDRSGARKSQLVGRVEAGSIGDVRVSHNTGGIVGFMRAATIANCTVNNTDFVESAPDKKTVEGIVKDLRQRLNSSDLYTSYSALFPFCFKYFHVFSFGYILGWRGTDESGNLVGTLSNNNQSANTYDLVFTNDVSDANRQDCINHIIRTTLYNRGDFGWFYDGQDNMPASMSDINRVARSGWDIKSSTFPTNSYNDSGNIGFAGAHIVSEEVTYPYPNL